MRPEANGLHIHSVAMTEGLDQALQSHLLQHVRANRRQEDICIALWHPSEGRTRRSAVLYKVLLPAAEDRTLSGNVSLKGTYLEKCLAEAATEKAGIAILHNHFTPDWQTLSPDDETTESLRAPSVQSFTNLPLIGMTLGTDGTWSARCWLREGRGKYVPHFASEVRSVGKALRVSFNPNLKPPPAPREELTRAISVWGPSAQSHLSRLHVGVVGVGSVGMMIVEGLGRMGVNRVTLIDFDHVERHNLDRLLGATAKDALNRTLKVEVAKRVFEGAATTLAPVAIPVIESVVDQAGYEAVLDCDLVFSCVDRPWPRQVLNVMAYAHLIPVVDGGVLVRMRKRKCVGVEWSVRTAGPNRQCLACAGAFNMSNVGLERFGDLDRPSYIQGLDEDHPLRRNENTFAFSMALAAQELAHFVACTTELMNQPDLGNQRFHTKQQWFMTDISGCAMGCSFQGLTATADRMLSRASYLRSTRDNSATRDS